MVTKAFSPKVLAFVQTLRNPKTIAGFMKDELDLQASGLLSEAELQDSRESYEGMANLPQEVVQDLDPFFRHMPDPRADISLTILKGHLLVEHAIWQLILARTLSPEILKEDQFESSQKIALGEALGRPEPHSQKLWSIVRQLNKLRNHIAHNLEPPKVDDRVASLLDACRGALPGYAPLTSIDRALSAVYGTLCALRRTAMDEEALLREIRAVIVAKRAQGKP